MKKHRLFQLNRKKDETGVSGTGIIAKGVQFPSGRCVLEWQTDSSSIAIYADESEMMNVHGHGGHTSIEWLDPKGQPAPAPVAVLIVDSLK